MTKVTYPVAELVVPIPDFGARPPRNGDGRTKEDWLIRKIMRTVSPDSWEGAGGTGTIQYFPLGKALVVTNTARVQARVNHMLETMRRVQDVQVAAEAGIVSLNAASFRTVRGLLPQLKEDGHVVLSDAEAFALLRKARDDAGTRVVQLPKITFLPGQRVRVSLDPGQDQPAIRKADVRLSALVAADLQRLELQVRAAVGKAAFARTVWLDEGATLAQVKRHGDGHLILLVTPRVILSAQEEVVAPPRSGRYRAAPPAAIPGVESDGG
jgi:hypothetical protein